MTGKEYLERIRHYEKERQQIEEEISEIRNRSLGLISKYENLISGKGSNRDLSRYIATLETKVAELIRKDEMIVLERDATIRLINKTDMCDVARQILLMRYVYYKSFEDIQEELYISRSLAFQRHREGVQAIDRALHPLQVYNNLC